MVAMFEQYKPISEAAQKVMQQDDQEITYDILGIVLWF